jgi:hypothetical protein
MHTINTNEPFLTSNDEPLVDANSEEFNSILQRHLFDELVNTSSLTSIDMYSNLVLEVGSIIESDSTLSGLLWTPGALAFVVSSLVNEDEEVSRLRILELIGIWGIQQEPISSFTEGDEPSTIWTKKH